MVIYVITKGGTKIMTTKDFLFAINIIATSDSFTFLYCLILIDTTL